MATTRIVTKPATTKVKAAGGKGITEVLKEGLEGPIAVPLDAIKELSKGNIGGAITAPLSVPVKGVEHGVEAIGELGNPVKAAENVAKSAGNVVQTGENVASTLGKLTEASTWIRIGKVIAGAVLIAIGLWMFAKAIAPGATNTVSKVATAPAKAYSQGATKVIRQRSRVAGERTGTRAVNAAVKPRTTKAKRRAQTTRLQAEGVDPSIVDQVADYEGFNK